MHMYTEADVNHSCLEGQQITVLGYGSQGRAHALNLKDSGFHVSLVRAQLDRASPRQRRTALLCGNRPKRLEVLRLLQS